MTLNGMMALFIVSQLPNLVAVEANYIKMVATRACLNQPLIAIRASIILCDHIQSKTCKIYHDVVIVFCNCTTLLNGYGT